MRSFRDKRGQYEQFAAAHGDGLVKLAFAVCGDRGRAEDAAQVALERVYRRWGRLSDPLPYARRIAVNAVRDDWRRAMRELRANEASTRTGPTDGGHPQDAVADRAALMSAIALLPHQQRAVIALRYGSQLTEAETAAVLEISLGTVKSYTARALERLRVELSPSVTVHSHQPPAGATPEPGRPTRFTPSTHQPLELR